MWSMAMMMMLSLFKIIFDQPQENFFYNIAIEAGKYYSVTASTTSINEACTVGNDRAGGPVAANVLVDIECN